MRTGQWPIDPAFSRGLIGTTEWRYIAPSRARHRPSNRGAIVIDSCTSVSSLKQRCAMTQRLKTLKRKAAQRQNWCCYYCDMPMWDDDLDQFVIRHRLTKRSAQTLKCTAEHLTAQCEGGKDRATNIVAACLICNRRRHQTSKPKAPDDYRRHIQRLIRKGKWHPLHVAIKHPTLGARR